MKLSIWLGDLGHSEVTRLRVVPLGIGCIASALREKIGNRIDTKLFVYPDKIITQLRQGCPDIIALSNYIWNHNLSLRVLRLAKELHPNVVTVMGGPHVRIDEAGLRDFVRKHPFLDVYLPFEGETSMCSFVGKVLETGSILEELGQIPGCYINIPNYRFERLQNRFSINEYGSPYLNGILDEFLDDERLFPLLETSRGCPYSCTFCAWGVTVGSVVQKKPVVMFQEAEYIAKRSSKDYWLFTDANFSMFKQDVYFAQHLKSLNERYGRPKNVNFHTAKNNAERMLETMRILEDMAAMEIAVQSMDTEVLKQMKRTNLKTQEIRHIVNMHHREGRKVTTDILLPGSAETQKSHISSIKLCIDIGFDFININLIRLLPGTEMETEESRKKYGVRTKWRPLDIGWGEYAGEFVFEDDETIVETSSMKEEEVYLLKKLHFLVYMLWNYGLGKPLLDFGQQMGINPVDIMLTLEKYELLDTKVLNPLCEEFKAEFFDSKEELKQHCMRPQFIRNVKDGEGVFQRLTLKYLAHSIYERERICNTIKMVRLIIEEKTNVSKDLLNVVSQMTLDALRLEPLTDDLIKTIRYDIGEDQFSYLKEIRIIPDGIVYDNNGFNVTYQYSSVNLGMLKDMFQRFDYQNKPTDALYTVLTLSDVGAFFTYKIAET